MFLRSDVCPGVVAHKIVLPQGRCSLYVIEPGITTIPGDTLALELLIARYPAPTTFGYVFDLFVRPGSRRFGIGRMILRTLEQLAPYIMLEAYNPQMELFDFYARCGYTRIADTRYHYKDRRHS